MATLSPKHELFCQEYLVDCNATKAAIRAGYFPSNAGDQGSDLMKRDEITQRISELMEERCRRTEITQDEILKGIRAIAYSAERDSDKLAAYEKLGRHINMPGFGDELNVNVNLARKAEEFAKLPKEKQVELMKAELLKLEGKSE